MPASASLTASALTPRCASRLRRIRHRGSAVRRGRRRRQRAHHGPPDFVDRSTRRRVPRHRAALPAPGASNALHALAQTARLRWRLCRSLLSCAAAASWAWTCRATRRLAPSPRGSRRWPRRGPRGCRSRCTAARLTTQTRRAPPAACAPPADADAAASRPRAGARDAGVCAGAAGPCGQRHLRWRAAACAAGLAHPRRALPHLKRPFAERAVLRVRAACDAAAPDVC
jgi:hypothetical protein